MVRCGTAERNTSNDTSLKNQGKENMMDPTKGPETQFCKVYCMMDKSGRNSIKITQVVAHASY